MIKRLTSWLLVLTMIVSLIPSTMITAFAAEGTPTTLTASSGVTLGEFDQRYVVTSATGDIEIIAGGTYELSGAKDGISVIVKTNDAVTLALNGLQMRGEKSPIQLQDGANVTLVLMKGTTNSITCTAATVTVTTTRPDLDWAPDMDAGETEENRPQIPVPGNDCMTAGIHVPENATLTIDKVKDETAGELTVQGGYGGAGIGGGAATPRYTAKVGETGAGGGAGGNGTGGGHLAQNGTGGAGGKGGRGGLFGQDAENAGTVLIKAGVLTVTGGENAAGIGGGRGADGQPATESGTRGINAGNGRITTQQKTANFGGGGGGSGGNGGNGGNGGKGGSLTALTVTGGTLTVVGGTYAAGIGGGAGGTGGNGGPGGAGGTGSTGGGSPVIYGGRGGDGATGAEGFKGASPGGDGGTVEITGGRVEITGYVAVGAGRTLWPSRPAYNRNWNAYHDNGRKGSAAGHGGNGGGNGTNIRPEPTAVNGSLTIQNANVKLNNTLPQADLEKEAASGTDLTMPNNYVRPMNGKVNNEPIYHLELGVRRLDQVTICEDADINLVLYRGDNAKQYTYTTTTGADGIAHVWLPAFAKNSETGDIEKDYNMYAVGNEIAHRAVGRLMPDTKLGIEVKNDDTSAVTAYIGVDYSANSTPDDAKVYRSVNSETYELLNDGKGEVKLRIDARTVPEDMDIIQLRWFRESVALNTEYDFQVIGSKLEFGKRFGEIQAATPANTGSSATEDITKGSAVIDMTPEQGEAGKRPRIWNLPMKENGRYWVELTYRAGKETPQKVVKGVVINNIFTSYPLWVRGFWALGNDGESHKPVSWLYGDGGTGENWQASNKNKYVRLLGANKQPQMQSYGIPWDLDGYSAEAMKNSLSDEEYDYATKIIDKDHVFKPAGEIDGFDRVKIYATDVLKTLYNADVGNFDANLTLASTHLNTGATDNPKELVLNAGYFASSATHYGEIVNGKQLFNKYLVRYLARDGSLNIVLMSGVDEAEEPLYDDVKMFTPAIKDADIRGWERPGSVVIKVEYAGLDGNWIDITTRNDEIDGSETLKIQTDLEGLKASFSKIEDVKKVRFTYKKSTTDVTVKAYYDTPEGEHEREIEGFVPYTIEADYGKYYTPTPLDLTKSGFERTRSNLTDDKILVKDPADQTFQEGVDNVIKFYFKKTEGNVTYRAVVKGRAVDGRDDQVVWSKNITVAINTAPQTQFTDGETAIPPTLTNYVIEGENGNVTITRQNGGAAATTYDGLHDLYVTYEYKKKTKDVKIVALNALSGDPIALEPDDATVTETTGEYHTFKAPDLAAKGYKVLQSQATQSYFVAADAKDPSVTFLYLPTENAETTVTLYYLDGEKEETIQVLRNEVKWGDTLTLQLPNLNGYTLVPNQNGVTETPGDGTEETKYSVTLTPKRDETGANATGTTIKVRYEKVAPVTITVKLVEQNVADSNLADKLINWTGTILVEKGGNATVTPPNIPGYTLVTSDPVSNPGESLQLKNVTADRTVTFTYGKTDDVSYVKHQIIGVIVENGVEKPESVFDYTNSVAKNNDSTTYYAPIQEGYVADQLSVTKPNNANAIGEDAVKFTYTANGATIVIKHVDEKGNPLTGVAEDEQRTGYKVDATAEKNLVTVNGPTVSGYACVGVWNAVEGTVDKTQKSKEIKLTAGNNEVVFAYEKVGDSDVTFTLTDADTNEPIRVVKGKYGVTYGTDHEDLTLTDLGYTFQKEGSSTPFNGDSASVKVENDSQKANYILKYKKATRPVTYKYMDETNQDDPKPIAFTDGNTNAATARVLEKFEAFAPHISGYAVSGTTKQVINLVANEESALTVTFNYVKKSDATITVEHKVKGETNPFSSYTVNVSDGEWFTASALTDNKYTLEGEKSKTVQANAQAAQTITFEYAKNYVTVKTLTNTDGNTNAVYQPGIEVVKTETATLNPPLRTGYVLKGIKVVTKGETDTSVGGEEAYPNGWNAETSTLTLSNLSSDTEVTYYYKTIEEALPEHQVTITVIEKHEAFTMSEKTYKVTKDREIVKNHAYEPNTYDGYRVAFYQVDNEVKQEIADPFTGVQVDHFQNHTITYTFVRTDGSVTVPGKDEKLPSKDDITIKPTDPTQKPTVDPDNGTVIVPDKGGEVVTPGGTVVVPGGSTVDKNGSIKGPDGKPIDPSNPGEVTGHYFIQYRANGGDGESYTEYFKTDASVTLKTVGQLFTKDGFTANNWNTYANGNGNPYEEAKDVSGKSLTLFAQWVQNEQATGRYTATVILKPNGASGNDDTYTIASNDNDPIREKIKENPFKLDDWTFKGWLTGETSGTYYANGAVAGVESGKTLTLFAQWVKENKDGSITVPGGDKLPNTGDDVTAKPDAGGTLDRNDKTGEITVPAGGSAVNKNGEIAMPNGGTVKPDGTIVVKDPKGDITIKPDGSVEEGSNTFAVIFKSGVEGIQNITKYVKTDSSITADADIFTYGGHVFAYWTKDTGEKFETRAQISEAMTLTAHWYVQKEDGSVVIPVPDGTGDIIVKPEGENKPSVDKDGNVTVPGTGPVETPDGPVVVPDGSVVKPDGSIVKPGENGGEDKIYPVPTQPGEKPAGYITITYKVGNVVNPEQYKPVTQTVKADSVKPLGNQFDVPGKTFLHWATEQGEKVPAGTLLTTDTVLIAQWKNAGSVVLSIEAGSKVKDGADTGEYKLILAGAWNQEATYPIPVLVDGKQPSENDLRWYVDANSYADEFGFAGSVLSGEDIVSVNAKTGEIKVKNSGIVRIYAESMANPGIKISVVVIVPGDIDKDGKITMNDASLVFDIMDGLYSTSESKEDHSTWYVFDLADLDKNGKLDMNDASTIFDIYDGISSYT